jgi:hypothetical protein
VSKSRPISTSNALRELQGRAQYLFSPDAFAELTGRTPGSSAATAAIARLAADGRVVLALKRPVKWLIVPPEHSHYGAPPVEWWLHDCMRDIEPHYYLGLLSAARHWGSAHQAPLVTQVVVGKRRLAQSIGKLRIEYIAKADVARTPVVVDSSRVARVRVSTREATLLDLVRHQAAVGGIEAVAAIARDFRDALEPRALTAALNALDQSAAAQRLGLVFEAQGQTDCARAVERWLARRNVLTITLETGESASRESGRSTNPRWRVRCSPGQLERLEGLP